MRAMWMPDSAIWRLAWLKRLSGGGGEKIEVTWNNFQPPFSTDLYRTQNSSNTALTDVGDGIVKQTWLIAGGGVSFSIRLKDMAPSVIENHVYYLSYCVNPSISGCGYGAGFAGRSWPEYIIAPAGVWSRFSDIKVAPSSGLGLAYFANIRTGSAPQPDDTCLAKAPIYVDLTLMYGAGNEPTLEEFERQCALNGIDLTQSQPQDNGTVRQWRV